MKNFLVRSLAILLVVVLMVGALYTCGIALYMNFLSSEVAEAELKALSGDPHMRAAADAIYEDVSAARHELYYGGGYKSWFSTAPKALQIFVLLIDVAIILLGTLFIYAFICAIKQEREEAKRRAYLAARRREAYGRR